MLPPSYPIRSLGRRPVRTAMTILGIGLVTALFAAMNAVGATMANAFQATGNDDEVVVTQAGSLFPDLSYIDRSALTLIQTLDEVAIAPSGVPLVSPEIYYTAPLSEDGGQELAVRGIRPIAQKVYREWSLDRGDWPAGPGTVAIGAAVAEELGLTLGDQLRFERQMWRVVGIVDSGGRIYDRELLVDLDTLAALTHRADYSAITVRADSPEAARALADSINGQERERIQAVSAPDFYAQSGAMASAMSGMGAALALLIALGAIFGGMNTMYSAVANRRRELGTLRALGFSKGSVLRGVLAEATILGFAGGLLGTGIASLMELFPLDLPYVVGDTIDIGPPHMISSLVLALCVGLMGGLFPAIRAARMSPAEAMR